MKIPKSVYLYDEGIRILDLKAIKEFIAGNFGDIKIHLIKLKKKAVKTRGLLFDFTATQKEFSRLQYSEKKDSCHIIFTDTLFATLDESGRPHIRSSIYSFPSAISVTGLIEGPAKPRDYYFYKQKYDRLGIWFAKEQEVKGKFKKCFLDYGDRRVNEALKGYVSQALFHYITGEPFCDKKECRLYNAHWQADLIYAQLRKKKFCVRHRALLKAIINARSSKELLYNPFS